MMKIAFYIVISFVNFFLVNSASSNELKFEVLFNRPDCPLYEYVQPIPSYGMLNVSRISNEAHAKTSKTKDIYCRNSDFTTPDKRRSSAYRRIKNIIKSYPIKKIEMAYFLFENSEIVELLCKQKANDSFKLRIAIQKGQQSKDLAKLKLCFARDLSVSVIGCDWFSSAIQCDTRKINTLHSKLMRITRENASQIFVFGSGNLNYSLYSTRDTWAILQANSEMALKTKEAGQLSCQFNTLFEHDWSLGINFIEFTKKHNDCLRTKNAFGLQLNLISFLLPTTAAKLLLERELPTLMNNADSLFITTQDLGGKKMRSLLTRFARPGKKLRILLDDDWFYVRFLGADLGMADYEIASGFLSDLAQIGGNVEIRYLETDNTAKFKTSLHHRIMYFENTTHPVVLFGSANLKDGAFHRNIENMHIIRKSDWASLFKDEIDYLWSRALPQKNMPTVDSNLFK